MSHSESSTSSPVPTASGYPFYKYKPLESEHHIRRLVLKPGQEDDPLCGTMESVNLDDKNSSGSYEAISYAWGNAVMNHWIVVDGFQLPITRNLFHALRRTRDPEKPRKLWADSICIWQDNKEEKGQQVSIMKRIFETSHCTLICLGIDSTDEEEIRTATDAAALVDEVDKMIQRVFDDDAFSWEEDSFPWTKENDPLVIDARWNAWDNMLSLPWFSRGWVVQEAASGPEAFVLWAKAEIKWSSILRVSYWLEMRLTHWDHSRRKISRLHTEQYRLGRPEERDTFWPQGLNESLEAGTTLDILTGGRRFELSVESDRIYAFIGLPTSDGGMDGLQANYEKAKMDVYWDFAVQYLQRYGDLDILMCVEHDDDSTLAENLSWVPRWDCGRMLPPFYDPEPIRITDSLAESEDSDEESEGSDEENEGSDEDKSFRFIDGGILGVKGLIIDSVQYASKEIQYHASTSENVREVVSLWEEVKVQSAAHPGPHQSELGFAFLHAFAKGRRTGDSGVWLDRMRSFAQLLQPDNHKDSMNMDTYMSNKHAMYCSGSATRGSRGRRFILLGRGNYGIAPKVTRVGDVCAVIYGAQTPFVLRKIAGKENCYKVVGATEVQSESCWPDRTPRGLGKGATRKMKAATYDWLGYPEVSKQAQEIMLC